MLAPKPRLETSTRIDASWAHAVRSCEGRVSAEGDWKMNRGIWRYNKITGIWRWEQNCQPEEEQQWLEAFKKHEPLETFVLSVYKPKGPPKPRKIKAVWKPDSSEPWLSKGRFGASKKTEYQRADWKWIIKRIAPESWKGEYNRPKAYLEVSVSDMEGKWSERKRFLPNELKQAKEYAQSLIESGVSRYVDINGRVNFPFEKDTIAQLFGSFEPEE
jgi:hypothetical protein